MWMNEIWILWRCRKWASDSNLRRATSSAATTTRRRRLWWTAQPSRCTPRSKRTTRPTPSLPVTASNRRPSTTNRSAALRRRKRIIPASEQHRPSMRCPARTCVDRWLRSQQMKIFTQRPTCWCRIRRWLSFRPTGSAPFSSWAAALSDAPTWPAWSSTIRASSRSWSDAFLRTAPGEWLTKRMIQGLARCRVGCHLNIATCALRWFSKVADSQITWHTPRAEYRCICSKAAVYPNRNFF